MRSVLPLLAAAFTACFFGSCSKSVNPTEATKAFFEKVKAGQINAAYQSSAFSFQTQQSQKFFETALTELGLNKIASVEYQPAEMEDDGRSAKVRAEFTVEKEKKVPVVVTLNRESGTWKVFAIKSPRNAATGMVENRFSMLGRGPDFVEAVDRQPVPEPEVIEALINDTLAEFNQAIRERNFLAFF